MEAMTNKVIEMIKSYKERADYSDSMVSTYSSEIMEKLEEEYTVSEIVDMLGYTSYDKNEDDMWWKCIDIIEDRLLSKEEEGYIL